MNPSRLGPRIDVRRLLAPERQALLDLLAGLRSPEWSRATSCRGWSVHDVAAHLLHDDFRRLSAQRDGYSGTLIDPSSLDELVERLDADNDQWVRTATAALSPRVTSELLTWTAQPTADHLMGLDPDGQGWDVAWAGPGPHPNWFDVAREFTERWVHHQQIREAIDRPGLQDQIYVEAVVDTFLRSLPVSLPPRAMGTQVEVRVVSPFARSWTLEAVGDGDWFFATTPDQPAVVVETSAQALWRRAVRMATHGETESAAVCEGDPELARYVIDLRSAIVRDDAP